MNEKTKNIEIKKETKITKIPDTLIIYVKTRIPNFYKFTYKPNMTLPESEYKYIYFNPLIKLDRKIVLNPPSYLSPNTRYTQFFNKNEFNSLNNRILSNFSTMQKEKTLEQATNENIINNNITITLEALFGNNSKIYLNNIPYTIIQFNNNNTDWELNIKPIEEIVEKEIKNYVPYKYTHLSNAFNELNNLPENTKIGNMSSSNLKKEEENSQIETILNENKEKELLEKMEKQEKIIKK